MLSLLGYVFFRSNDEEKEMTIGKNYAMIRNRKIQNVCYIMYFARYMVQDVIDRKRMR